VIPLKYANATEVVNVLGAMVVASRQFGPPGRQPEMVLADARTNSLVVRAPEDVLQQITEIVKTLDVEAPRQTQLKVFELLHAPAADMRTALQEVAGSSVKIAVDAVGNRVLAQGDAESLEIIEALLMRLDQPPPKPAGDEASAAPAEDVQVRLVWLVAGLKDSAAAPPPEDLANVIQELEKMGVEGLKTAAQVFVKTVSATPFQVSGAAMLNEPCSLEVTGSFARKRSATGSLSQGQRRPNTSNTPPAVLEISVSATSEQGQHLANLQTTITAPEGHSVVLGVSPVGELTSVFVVQVRR
jgi:hypothetical protein